MEKISNIIIFTTAYLVFYTVGTELGVLPEVVIISLFTFSPFLMIYMVIKVLKDGEAPDLAFEDGYWYEDMDQIESARNSA